jgi:hypothetical protein
MSCEAVLDGLRNGTDKAPPSREEALERAYDMRHALLAVRRAKIAVSRPGPQRDLSRVACRVRRAPRFIRGHSAVRRRTRTGARGEPDEPAPPLGGLLVRSGVAA